MAGIYAQIECGLPRDPKMIQVGPHGRITYIQFILYARENLLDGVITDIEMGMAMTDIPNFKKNLARLAEVGALERIDGAWKIPAHVWSKRNPTRKEVEAKGVEKREAGKRGNHQRWHVEKGEFDPKCEHCIANRSQGATETDRTSETGAIAKKKRERESESQRESHSESQSSSSSSGDLRSQGHATDDDDDLAMLVLGLLATDWTKQNAQPGKERGYRQAVIRNGDDHLPLIRELITERPRAEPRSITAAYLAGGWARAINPDTSTSHPSTCVCEGNGMVPVDPDNDGRDGYVRPCTAEQNLATVHALRGTA